MKKKKEKKFIEPTETSLEEPVESKKMNEIPVIMEESKGNILVEVEDKIVATPKPSGATLNAPALKKHQAIINQKPANARKYFHSK